MKTLNAYLFNELSQEAKDLAIHNFDTDHLYDHDPILEGMKEDLQAIGLEDIDIQYSGFWSQGDGLSFTASVHDMALFCNHIGVPAMGDVDASFYRTTSRYLHENTCTTEVNFIQAPESSEHEGQLDLLQQAMELWRKEECRRLYKVLERYYEECISSEAIIEHLEVNEYHFLEDGTRVRV